MQLIIQGLEWSTKIATDPQNLQTNKTPFFFYRSSIVKKQLKSDSSKVKFILTFRRDYKMAICEKTITHVVSASKI